MTKFLATAVALGLFCSAALAQIPGEAIKEIVEGKKAQVGVAVYYEGNSFSLNNAEKYPLMSLFKLHVAAAALKKMELQGIDLDSKVRIRSDQMRINTYSPLRDRFPKQDIEISYREIIDYTMIVSDNNTCDWLIEFVGGIDQVDTFVKRHDIQGTTLSETEDGMHQDILRSYNNYGSPASVVEFLRKIYEGKVLSTKHFSYLESTMLRCTSGTDKLRAGVDKKYPLAHKTGHSDRTKQGVRIAETDAGVIYFPDGTKCFVAVLIKDSSESDAVNAAIMADVARVLSNKLKPIR